VLGTRDIEYSLYSVNLRAVIYIGVKRRGI
jgi:hypothetical protein